MKAPTYDDMLKAMHLMKKTSNDIPDVILVTPLQEVKLKNASTIKQTALTGLGSIHGIPIFVYNCEEGITDWIANFKITRGREPKCIRLVS